MAGEALIEATTRSLSRYPYLIGIRELLDASNASWSLEGHVQMRKEREEEWRYGNDDPQMALNWSFTSSAQGQYARMYGGTNAQHRRVVLMRSTANASFQSPGACFSQNLSSTDGGIAHASFRDECVDC